MSTKFLDASGCERVLPVGTEVQAFSAVLDAAAASLSVAQVAQIAADLPTVGAVLTDADAAVVITGGVKRTLPAATLTANRVATLGVTGSPVTGETITIIRQDATAFTYTVKDDAAATLIVLPVSTKFEAVFKFDGTHFALLSATRIQ